jgi:RecA-family ATPase
MAADRNILQLQRDIDQARPPSAPPPPPQPWIIAPASSWAERAPPAPRDWIAESIGIAAGRTTSFMGNGGFGKTQVAAQILVAIAASGSLWGMPVKRGPVVGIFCEDEQDEIERRVRLIAEREGIDLDLLDNLHPLSRDGEDTVLASFDRDLIQLTDAYWRLDATVGLYRPRLTVLDAAADLFAGDFMSTPHVRQFIKIACGGLCKRWGTGILLLAHPSASAMSSGDGGGFSTAWNNSVRSRLYLRRPKSDDTDAIADRRILEVKKSNYGPTGQTIPMIYQDGRFIIDPEPIEEGSKPARAPKTDTRLSLAVMGYFNARASSGQVASFGNVFEALQKAGDIPAGVYQTVRKPLQRTLKDLVATGLLQPSDVPRGYRLAPESRA